LPEWIDINEHMNVAYYILVFDQGYLSATAEWMNLHVDLDTRRVAPWPEEILSRIADFAAAQGEQPWPAEAGRTMHIQKPLFTIRTAQP
jgi:acyl-CoA thioester hydrolase